VEERVVASRSAIPAWVRAAPRPSWPCPWEEVAGLGQRRTQRAAPARAADPAPTAGPGCSGYAAPPEPETRPAPAALHLEADHPGTRGRVWQYTAIDVASAFAWASVHVTPVNPAVRHTTALVERVARELAAAGWKLRAVSTDNGSEFRGAPFTQAVHRRGAEHRFIRAGRPQTNGCVERLHRTVLEECWRPTFATLVPKFTALRRDLDRYLCYYNFERAHTGLRSRGQTPAAIVYGARKMRPR